MPKLKTRRAALKRLKINKKGKIFRKLAFRSHLLEGKSPGKKRGFHKKVEIKGADYNRMRRLLAGAKPN